MKTTEEYKEDVYKLVGNNFEVVGKYKGSKEKILMKHNICGTEFYITPTNFLSSYRKRCPGCIRRK